MSKPTEICLFFFLRSVNSDGLTPLDVAFLSGNQDLVRLLLMHGATEGKQNYKIAIKNGKSTILINFRLDFSFRDEYETFRNPSVEFARRSRKTGSRAEALRQPRRFADQVTGTVGEAEKRLEKNACWF